MRPDKVFLQRCKVRPLPTPFTPPSTPTLQRGRTRIGRSKTQNLVILSQDVSDYHAELIVSKSGVRIQDMGSTNGTYINYGKENGVLLEPYVAERLSHGDTIKYVDYPVWLSYLHHKKSQPWVHPCTDIDHAKAEVRETASKKEVGKKVRKEVRKEVYTKSAKKGSRRQGRESRESESGKGG